MKMHEILRKKKINFFWILYGFVLVVLFLLSSTDLIIKEEEAEIYPVSVIIGDTSDENYVNFRKGMDQAARAFNGDVVFITLYEKGSASQQEELMLREQEDGSRALVVSLVEDEIIIKMRRENLLSVPVVCVNSEWEVMEGLDNTAVLTFDYFSMGYGMGEEIIRDHPLQKKVYLLEEETADAAGRLFSKGVCEALGDEICTALSLEELFESRPGEFQERTDEDHAQEVIFVASTPECLLKTAQFLSETKEAAGWDAGLYGRGNTVPILNYLDKGIIQGLSVTDDFSAGYLSIKTAVEMLENRSLENMGYLESYYIRREDLRNEKYEKVLYPIE